MLKTFKQSVFFAVNLITAQCATRVAYASEEARPLDAEAMDKSGHRDSREQGVNSLQPAQTPSGKWHEPKSSQILEHAILGKELNRIGEGTHKQIQETLMGGPEFAPSRPQLVRRLREDHESVVYEMEAGPLNYMREERLGTETGDDRGSLRFSARPQPISSADRYDLLDMKTVVAPKTAFNKCETTPQKYPLHLLDLDIGGTTSCKAPCEAFSSSVETPGNCSSTPALCQTCSSSAETPGNCSSTPVLCQVYPCHAATPIRASDRSYESSQKTKIAVSSTWHTTKLSKEPLPVKACPADDAPLLVEGLEDESCVPEEGEFQTLRQPLPMESATQVMKAAKVKEQAAMLREGQHMHASPPMSPRKHLSITWETQTREQATMCRERPHTNVRPSVLPLPMKSAAQSTQTEESPSAKVLEILAAEAKAAELRAKTLYNLTQQ